MTDVCGRAAINALTHKLRAKPCTPHVAQQPKYRHGIYRAVYHPAASFHGYLDWTVDEPFPGIGISPPFILSTAQTDGASSSASWVPGQVLNPGWHVINGPNGKPNGIDLVPRLSRLQIKASIVGNVTNNQGLFFGPLTVQARLYIGDTSEAWFDHTYTIADLPIPLTNTDVDWHVTEWVLVPYPTAVLLPNASVYLSNPSPAFDLAGVWSDGTTVQVEVTLI